MPPEEDQGDVRLGQQDEGIDPPEAREVSMPPDRLVTRVRSDTLKRMYVTRGLGKKYDVPRMAVITKPVITKPVIRTCRDRMRAELEKSEEGREYLARDQARVDARRQEQSSSSSHKRAVSEELDRPQMDEEDVTKRQDVTATSGASPSSASRGPAMDSESQPSRKRAADVQTKDFEDNEQMDANESAASFPQAEEESSDGRVFIGNWEHDESELQSAVNQVREERGIEREAHSDGDQLSSRRFHFTCFCEGSLPKQKIHKRLERNEHKNIGDLREDISCGIQLQHKWSRQHKYLLASVDVKNPQANCDDLENSVPPEASNDDLLDQAR